MNIIVCFDWALFWTGVSAITSALTLIATMFIYYLAKNELQKNNDIAGLDVYFKIKADLSSLGSQKIYVGITEDDLKFYRNHDNSVMFQFDSTKEIMPMSDMDLHFLNHLEDLALAYEKKIIPLDMIRSGYSSLIISVVNSPTVYDYISYIRSERDNDHELYSGLENLYKVFYNEMTADARQNLRPSL